jgi:hypothetical protein
MLIYIGVDIKRNYTRLSTQPSFVLNITSLRTKRDETTTFSSGFII